MLSAYLLLHVHGQVLRELASHVAHAPSEVVEAMFGEVIDGYALAVRRSMLEYDLLSHGACLGWWGGVQTLRIHELTAVWAALRASAPVAHT